VPYWGSFVENVPLVYVDPSGHAGCIVEDGDEYCADDIPDELLLDPPDWLIDLLADPDFIALLKELLPDITGGVRVDGSYWILPFVAIDGNLDFVGNLSEMDGRIYGTLGLQGGFGFLGSVNVGPVVGLDGTSVEEWSEIRNHVGATLSDDIISAILSSEIGGILAGMGIEPDYGWGSSQGGHRPQSLFLSLVGIGEEASGWEGTEVFGVDLTSGDASFGFGSKSFWEGNVQDVVDSVKSLFVDQGSGQE
jgi:hypothetical protein